jgi:hypothetical protein
LREFDPFPPIELFVVELDAVLILAELATIEEEQYLIVKDVLT